MHLTAVNAFSLLTGFHSVNILLMFIFNNLSLFHFACLVASQGQRPSPGVQGRGIRGRHVYSVELGRTHGE